MWHDFIILTTFLIYLFTQGDVEESFILFKSEQLKVKVFRKISMIQIMPRVVSGIMGHRVLRNIFQKMKPSGLEVG